MGKKSKETECKMKGRNKNAEKKKRCGDDESGIII